MKEISWRIVNDKVEVLRNDTRPARTMRELMYRLDATASNQGCDCSIKEAIIKGKHIYYILYSHDHLRTIIYSINDVVEDFNNGRCYLLLHNNEEIFVS